MTCVDIVLGVDVGGTKVAAGVVDSCGNILYKTRVPMKTSGTAEEALDCVHAAIRDALASESAARVSAIGIASPGPLDLPSGIVLHTPNLPCWRDYPLGDMIRVAYPFPVKVDNDANAAGLAEARWGAAKGYRNVFYVTIGTGIGTALVLDEQLYYGRTGAAPEGGHMTLDSHAPVLCGCGKRGCLEGLASGPAIARRAKERLAQGRASVLRDEFERDASTLNTKMIAAAWRSGDQLATDILRETADLLTVWLGNIIDLIEPDIIVFGGGVANVIVDWFDYISEHLPSCSINTRCCEIPFSIAKYGGDAGIAGAAALCTAKSHLLESTALTTRG